MGNRKCVTEWPKFQCPWTSLLLCEIFLTPTPRKMSHVFTTICLHINRRVHVACDISGLMETEGLLKIIDSYVHPKSCVEIVTYFLQCAVE